MSENNSSTPIAAKPAQSRNAARRDPFKPLATPSQALWAHLTHSIQNILADCLPQEEGFQPTVRQVGLIPATVGQVAVIAFADHRLLLRVVLDATPTGEDEPVELRIAFDDPDLPIPEMSATVLCSAAGSLDGTVALRDFETIQAGKVRTRASLDETASMFHRHAEIVRLMIDAARRHRHAHRKNMRGMERQIIEGEASIAREAAPTPLRPDPFNLNPSCLFDGPIPTPTKEEAAAAPPQAQTSGLGCCSDDDEDGPAEPLFPGLDPAMMAGKTEISLYDLADLAREIALRPPGDNNKNGPSQTAMLKRLLTLGPDGARRWLEHAQAPMIEAIEDVGRRAPHFAPVTDLVLVHARASLHTGTPMRLPPLLVVDEPGTGKTWYFTRLAQALGVPFRTLSMAAISLGESIQGSHPSWRNSAQGLVSKALLAEPIANPFVFIDEFDKPTSEYAAHGSLYRPYYSALEPENARRFIDEFLGLAMDASHIQWTLAANDIERIPEPIRDRITQVRLAPMTVEHRRIVAQSIYRDGNARLKNWYAPTIGAQALAALETQTPRRMRKALDMALVYAGGAGRREVSVADIAAGLAHARSEESGKTWGFVSGRPPKDGSTPSTAH